MRYTCSIEEMLSDKRDKCVIDVRGRDDHEKGSFPGAINIELDSFYDEASKLPKDRPVYLLCYNGRRSDDIAKDFSEKGYEIYSIERGYYAYIRHCLHGDLMEEEKTAARRKEIERSLIKKYRKEIWSRFTRAINEYRLISDGDSIAVCISGGKDSMVMAKLFQELKLHGKNNFEVTYLLMNPGYNDENYGIIMDNAKLLNIPLKVFTSDIYDTVAGIPDNPCYLCARMRRGHLYAKAKEYGCNKIALGHHYDDVIETILMGMLYGGQVQTMMPKLRSTNFEGMELIRPMYLVREADIIRFRDSNRLNFIRCACRLTESCVSCGGTDQGSKRGEIKELIRSMKETNPYVESNIFRSVENVHLATVVGYKDAGGKRHHFLDDYENTDNTDKDINI